MRSLLFKLRRPIVIGVARRAPHRHIVLAGGAGAPRAEVVGVAAGQHQVVIVGAWQLAVREERKPVLSLPRQESVMSMW